MVLDAADIAKSLRLIGHATNPDLPDARRSWLLDEYKKLTPSQWLELAGQADRSSLLPAWHVALKRLGLADFPPDNIREATKAAWLLNKDRNMHLREEATDVAKVLNKAGVRNVYVKGLAHILGDTYPDPGTRLSSDIDILVEPERVDCAVSALFSVGFRFDGDHHETGKVPMYHLSHHLAVLRKKGNIASVELHFALEADGRFPYSVQDLLSGSIPAPSRPDTRISCAEHAIAISIAHSFLRNGDTGQDLHLRDMMDAISIARGDETVWKSVSAAFISSGAQREFEAFLYLCREFFGVDMTETMKFQKITRQREFEKNVIIGRTSPRNSRRPILLRIALLRWAYLVFTRPSYRLHALEIFTNKTYRRAWRGRRRQYRDLEK